MHTVVEPYYSAKLDEALAADRGGGAVRLFLREVGVPGIALALMRFIPTWSKLKAVAHTLPYDFAILDGLQAGNPLPHSRWVAVTMPALVVVGGKSPAWLHHGTRALADVLANARHRVLEGQTHMVKAESLAPTLEEFFTSADGASVADVETRSTNAV